MKQTCIACKSSDIVLKYSEVGDYEYGTYHNVGYEVCQQCGLLWQFPLPRVKDIPLFYPSHYRNHLQFKRPGIYPALKKFQVRWLAKDLAGLAADKNSHILEIGCGSGLLLYLLKLRGYRYLKGTDFSAAASKFLTHNGISFKVANIDTTFPYKERFDLIILNHVIEHVLRPDYVLSRCKSHLAQGGKVVVMTPNSQSLVFDIFGKLSDGLNAPRHIYLFSPKSIEALKSRLGFGNVSYRPMVDPMQWAISLQNVFQQTAFFRTTIRKGLAWYTIIVGVVCIPLASLTWFGKKSASMMAIFE